MIGATLLETISGELEALVAKTTPAVVAVQHRRGQGSGVILTPDGYVLTNRHVVRGTGELEISFAGGGALAGEVIGEDERSDLAVVRVYEKRPLESLTLAARHEVRVGQLVVAIGHPLWFERSVSLGVISALDRTLQASRSTVLEGLIQTDAAINPGNSGGPLVDASGRVVGINTAIIPFAQGIGFAIPAHTASWIAAVLIKSGRIERPYLGIAARSEELDAALARDTGQPRAVRVLRVGEGTPAAKAGLRRGDLLVAVNGSPSWSIDDLQRVIVLAEARDAQIDVFRGTARIALSVRPDRSPRAA